MGNQQRNSNLLEEIKTKYLNGESMNKLSQEYSINIGTLRYNLIKLGVTIRSVKESVKNHFKKDSIVLSKQFKELLIGMLLGDGGLRLVEKAINPYFQYTDKHKEVIEYTIILFQNEGIKCGNIQINKSSGCYSFQSESRIEFLDLYNLFYPKEIMDTQKQRRKILPNLTLTKISLLWWYIGDGGVKKQGGTLNNAAAITCKHLNQHVVEWFKININNDITTHCDSRGNMSYKYYFNNKSFIKLLNYIGECPIPCYNYKWVTRRSETIMEES